MLKLEAHLAQCSNGPYRMMINRIPGQARQGRVTESVFNGQKVYPKIEGGVLICDVQ